MKALTDTAKSHCASRYNEPMLLLEIDWSDTETGYYAERSLIIGSAAYAGVILQVGPITCSLADLSAEFRPVVIRLSPDEELANKIAGTVPAGRPARIKLSFVGADAKDAIELFSGHVDTAQVMGAGEIEMTLVGFFRKYDLMLPRDIVSAQEFPKAQDDDVGRPFPIVYGEAPRLPALKVKTGRITRLRGSILSSDTTIEVEDVTGFPSSGTLLIEDEQITYTGVSDNVFTGCSRGANGTEAVDHLNRRQVAEYMTEHIYLVAGHACKSAEKVRVAGMPVAEGSCAIDRNNTTLLPGKTLTTLTFVNRPRVRSYSRASRFLEMQFDATAAGNEAVNPEYCYDTTLEGFATLVAKISGASDNDTLRIKQTTDVLGYAQKYGEILKVFLMVEHYESRTFADDYLSVTVGWETFKLAKPSEEDTAGGGGEVDLVHGHSHSIAGEHTHDMTLNYEALFTDNLIQVGGTTGSWQELDDITGNNLNKSGFTTSPDTDRSLQCFVAATTYKGALQRIRFCCRRGESGMAGSFWMRFYRNGSLEKTYSVAGASTPTTYKSGWETIDGLAWGELDDADTYIMITPQGNDEIRLFGVWYEIEYIEQPAGYEGSGTKAADDVADHSGTSGVINEEPISSTSVVEAVDITDMVANDWSWFNDREVSVKYNVVGADDGLAGYILHVFFDVEFAPFEEIISDEISCDVQGIESAGDGTGALVENPADIIEHLLVTYLGFDESMICSASFESARTYLHEADARFGFALLNQVRTSDLLAELAGQARCHLKFDSGKFHLVYRSDSLGEPARAIADGSTAAGSSRIERGGVETICNRVIGYHSRDYSRGGEISERYPNFSLSEDAQSQAAYGVRELVLELSAIRNSDYAQAVVDSFLNRRAEPARLYRWRSLLCDVDLERTDIVEISDLTLDLLKVNGEIVESNFLAGSGNTREIDAIAFGAELEAFEFYWSVPGGTFLRLVDNTFYFVVRRALVARLTADGVLYLKGFVVSDQSLPAASANPLSFDSDREALAFALSDNTRVAELDHNGNLLLPISQETDQELSFAGTADSIEADADNVWFNIGSTRAAEITAAGLLRLPKYIVEDSNWELLYG